MVDYRQVDEAIVRYLQQNNNHWLLNQTLVNAKMRRDILGMLPIQPNLKVLDVGTGFGAVSFDLASQLPVQIEAIDIELDRIEIAKDMQSHLENESVLIGDITFSKQDLYELPFEDQQFNLVIAWFVFQHLNNVKGALQELKRVMAPGGYLCIIDVDDQLVLSYPNGSESVEAMQKAFRTLQEKRGGDRYIGRKLPTYLYEEGFQIVGTGIQAQTNFSVPSLKDPARLHEMNLYKNMESELLEKQVMTKEEFESHIQEIMSEKQTPSFKSNAQVIVVGQVPETN